MRNLAITVGVLTVLMVAPASWADGKQRVVPIGPGGPREDMAMTLEQVQKVKLADTDLLKAMTFLAMATEVIRVTPPEPEPLQVVPTIPKPVFGEFDPLGILKKGETKKGEEKKDKKAGDTDKNGIQLAMAGPVTPPPAFGGPPPKPTPTYTGDAAQEQIKKEVMEKLYQAYLKYYNGKHGDRIMKKLKEMYAKYEAEMKKYYKALNTCPVCGLAVSGGTVYYCQGTMTQATTPLAIFINFMETYHPVQYKEMVDQGILPPPAN